MRKEGNSRRDGMRTQDSFPETDEVERVRRHVERVRERIRELESSDVRIENEAPQPIRL